MVALESNKYDSPSNLPGKLGTIEACSIGIEGSDCVRALKQRLNGKAKQTTWERMLWSLERSLSTNQKEVALGQAYKLLEYSNKHFSVVSGFSIHTQVAVAMALMAAQDYEGAYRHARRANNIANLLVEMGPSVRTQSDLAAALSIHALAALHISEEERAKKAITELVALVSSDDRQVAHKARDLLQHMIYNIPDSQSDIALALGQFYSDLVLKSAAPVSQHRANFLFAISEIYQNLGRFEDARVTGEDSLAQYEELGIKKMQLQVMLHMVHLHVRTRTGELQTRLQPDSGSVDSYIQKIQDIYPQVRFSSPVDAANYMIDLATSLIYLPGFVDQSMELLTVAENRLNNSASGGRQSKKSLDRSTHARGLIKWGRGLCAIEQNDWQSAIDLLTEAEPIIKLDLLTDQTSTFCSLYSCRAIARCQLAELYNNREYYVQAIVDFRSALSEAVKMQDELSLQLDLWQRMKKVAENMDDRSMIGEAKLNISRLASAGADQFIQIDARGHTWRQFMSQFQNLKR